MQISSEHNSLKVLKHIVFGVQAAFVLTMAFESCNTPDKEEFDWNGGKVWLDRKNDTLSFIRYSKDGEIVASQRLPWPVYRFTYGDLDCDSIPEVAVGVIKETYYWKQMDRRLFIYQIYKDQHIVPLWLGSHVASELMDFKIDRRTKPAMVRTIERRKDSSLYEAEYYLSKFGLKFKRYINESATIKHY